MLIISDHAVTRYIERVKPAITREQAMVELERLAEMAERKKGKDMPYPFRQDRDYLILSDGIYASVVPSDRGDGGREFITSLLTRAGMAKDIRAKRNRHRSWKTRRATGPNYDRPRPYKRTKPDGQDEL